MQMVIFRAFISIPVRNEVTLHQTCFHANSVVSTTIPTTCFFHISSMLPRFFIIITTDNLSIVFLRWTGCKVSSVVMNPTNCHFTYSHRHHFGTRIAHIMSGVSLFQQYFKLYFVKNYTNLERVSQLTGVVSLWASLSQETQMSSELAGTKSCSSSKDSLEVKTKTQLHIYIYINIFSGVDRKHCRLSY